MLAFVHIEKTAGTTIMKILQRSFGPYHCEVQTWHKKADVFSADDFRRLQKLYPRIESIGGHKVKPYSDLESVCPDIRYYVFLREPLARYTSHYQYWIQVRGESLSFDDWISMEYYRNLQTLRIAGAADLDKAKMLLEKCFFVGLVEHFDESLVMLQKKVGCLNIFYYRENTAPNNKIKASLLGNARTKTQIEEANRIDLELYRFAMEELYPKQREEYGDTLDADVAIFKKANHPSDCNQKQVMCALKKKLLYSPALFYYRRFRS